MQSAKVEPEGGAKVQKGGSDWKLWISIVITAVIFGAIGVVLPDSNVGGAAADSINPIRMVKNFFVGGGSGMAFHIIFMLFFMWKKKSDLAKEASKNYGETTLTADGKNVIYARKMTLCQKLFAMTVGLLISIVDLILSVLAFVGIDLKVCFFPLPFYNYWKSKLLVSNMRVKGAKMRLNATYSDAYFLWLKIQRNNLLTCGCYAKRCNKLGYEKWLDAKLQWYGTPPPGFTNEFRIFAVRASLCERLQIAAIKFFFGLVLSPCGPLTTPYVLLKAYKFEVSHMILGGVTPTLNENWTYQNVLKKFWLSCCGFRKLVVPKFVDECIAIDINGGNAAPASPDMERQ